MEIARAFQPLFTDPQTHNILEGGRGGAKTWTVASLIVAIMAQSPLKVLCGREVQKSLKESSFQALEQEIYKQGVGHKFIITPSKGMISSTEGGRAVFIGLQDHTVDSIKSYEGFHWAWIEEAQSVSTKSLQILIPTLRADGWFQVTFGEQDFIFPLRMFLYTMNPYSWDDPINFVLPESRTDTQRIKVNWMDNPWFPASLDQERQQAKETMHPDEYDRIWEGIPYEDSERAVMNRARISGAMNRKASRDGGIVVGADIARFGTDRTIFFKREGMQIIDMKVLSKKDTQEVARQLYNFADGGKIMVDDTGVGGGVTDKLKDIKREKGDQETRIVPINFGGKAMDKKKYPEIISEMWFSLSNVIDKAGLPNDKELLQELSSRHYKYTADERRKVESKEEYKKRTGRRSPDMADALILCYYNRGKKAISYHGGP